MDESSSKIYPPKGSTEIGIFSVGMGAFERGEPRESNPYIGLNIRSADLWFMGFDEAKVNKNVDLSNNPYIDANSIDEVGLIVFRQIKAKVATASVGIKSMNELELLIHLENLLTDGIQIGSNVADWRHSKGI